MWKSDTLKGRGIPSRLINLIPVPPSLWGGKGMGKQKIGTQAILTKASNNWAWLWNRRIYGLTTRRKGKTFGQYNRSGGSCQRGTFVKRKGREKIQQTN